jgi:hypothetical protein
MASISAALGKSYQENNNRAPGRELAFQQEKNVPVNPGARAVDFVESEPKTGGV